MTSYVVHQEAFPLYMGSLKYIRLVFLYVQFFSFCTSPTYNLSKFLATLLSPLVGESPSAVRNSRDFVSFVSSLRPDPDEVLVSFDVVSLFIKVPIVWPYKLLDDVWKQTAVCQNIRNSMLIT